MVAFDGETEPPFWRKPEERDPEPTNVMPAANGLVDLGSDPPEVRPLTPRFFSTYVLPYGYDPCDAPGLTYGSVFLRDQWADDQESMDTLHEVMGYLLTPDTRYHKMFLLMARLVADAARSRRLSRI